MQDTSVLGVESHKLHLHGDNFIIEQGFDNYDLMNDPAKLNLVDLVERNTIDIPTSGWVVNRFLADNPGLSRLECIFS
ncbi:unnamed protein product [Musa acuminata subsp. malaccensis]|uniref:(wild Malaysian banana) hypothetical protein n=1 Tax=Musa acuminata subsp. malaccensis TaxID=214687 RepID=A0A804IRV0_MUSAM|nr:unnamed protein product [Musa acuminata subsp. malaccensis]